MSIVIAAIIALVTVSLVSMFGFLLTVSIGKKKSEESKEKEEYRRF